MTKGSQRTVAEKVELMGSPRFTSEVGGGRWMTGTGFPPAKRNSDGKIQYSPENGIDVGRRLGWMRGLARYVSTGGRSFARGFGSVKRMTPLSRLAGEEIFATGAGGGP